MGYKLVWHNKEYKLVYESIQEGEITFDSSFAFWFFLWDSPAMQPRLDHNLLYLAPASLKRLTLSFQPPECCDISSSSDSGGTSMPGSDFLSL